MTPSVVKFGLPNALAAAGLCLRLSGRRTEAIAAFTEAISHFEQYPLTSALGGCLENLASLVTDDGRAEEGRVAYTRASQVFEEFGEAEAASRCRDLAAGTG